MRNLKTLITVLLCVAALCAGCGDGRTDGLLSQIDTLTEARPDFALRMLDSLGGEKAGWSRRLRMKYDLLHLKAENKAFVPLTSDSVARDLVDYYDTWGNANERMTAHYLLGCVYRDKGDSPQAIDTYLDAVAQADTTSKDCDFRTISRIYAQMAGEYHKQLLLTSEIKVRKQASYYSFLAGDTFRTIFNIEKCVPAYIMLNKKDSAEIILKRIRELYINNGLYKEALQSSIVLMFLYSQDITRNSELHQLINEYEKESTFFDKNHELPPSKRQYYYYKGLYYENNHQLDSAEYNYRKVYRPNMSFSDKDPMYRGLLSVFSKRHQSDSIAKYARLYCEVNDSSIAKKDQELTAQMAASYNYNLHQKEAHESEAKAHRFFLWLIVILFSFLIFVIMTLYVYRNIKLKKQAVQDDYIRLQQEKMALEELLAQNQNSYAVEIEEKRATIEALETKLKENRTYQEFNAIDETIKGDEIVEKFKNIANGRGNAPTYSEWAKLQTLIDSVLPHFVPFIKTHCPAVSESDIELCMLVRLGFRTDQIATLMHLTPSGVSKSKARLLQKIFHEDIGGAKEFEKRLLAIR